MDVRWLSEGRVERYDVHDVEMLLKRDDGFVWVDMMAAEEADSRALADTFSFHPLAIRDCVERNPVPKVHAYTDHLIVVLHAPFAGRAGHVHYIELDQLMGPRFLVTVHGPINALVNSEVCGRETSAVMKRLEAGRLRPSTPGELSHAIVTALARTQRAYVDTLTQDVWRLEQRVTGGDAHDAEVFLEELFAARHGLLAVRTMGAQSSESYARVAALRRASGDGGGPEFQALVEDVIDQFDNVRRVADSEKEYLQGVIDFYRARTETKMTIAAERLAVIAVITLPVTALSSIYGMNIIVNDRTHLPALIGVIAVMVVMSITLLTWAKRQGWW